MHAHTQRTQTCKLAVTRIRERARVHTYAEEHMRAHPEIRPSSIAIDLDRGAAIFHACFLDSPRIFLQERGGRLGG